MTRTLLLILAAAVLAAQSRPEDDVLLRAMRDELERSRQLRVIGGGDPPYFISYSITDAENFSVEATLGAILSSSRNRFRAPLVEVRTGSYEFDNTNHVTSGFLTATRYDPDQWSLDDNYDFFRHAFWLATDRAFKSALDALGRKRASLKNAQPSEQIPDFSAAAPVQSLLKIQRKKIDETAWKERVARLSAIFKEYPEILTSSVELTILQGGTWLANSEGTAIRYQDNVNVIRAKAEAQTPDGVVIRDAVSFQSLDPDQLPAEAELRRAFTELAGDVRAFLKAPAGEAYSGPVLFESRAAAQLFAQLLGDNLRLPRKPLADPGRSVPFLPSEFDTRIGSRILPDWIDVVDDATKQELNGRPLLGYYEFDMEGVPPSIVKAVEKGVLKTVLLTRQPVKNFISSNGHARLLGNYGARTAAIGNLFVRASETIPEAQMKARLIEMCRERSKPYGILVRRLDYPFSGSIREIQSLAQAQRDSRPFSPPLLIYRVYPDGREELIRGVRFRGLSSRALRDIVAASDTPAIFDFINNSAPLAATSAGGYLSPSAVIAPSILFEELELERPEDQNPKPPLIPPPPVGQ